MLGGFEKALLAILLLVLMTGIGTTLSSAQFKAILAKPKGVLIGLASQFGWMPLIAFGLARALDLPTPMAIGLVLIGCTPGGTTSNLFTYYAKADVVLSVSMTVVSTAVAVVVMPLLLVLYAAPLSSAEMQIPLGSIISTLVLVLVPVAAGIFIRAKNVDLAAKVERAGSIAGIVVLVLLVGSSLLSNHEDLLEIPASGYAAAIALGVLGMGLGYVAARIVGMNPGQRRAVALETGIQNSPLAFGLILASFPEAEQRTMLWLPMLYALFVLLSASLATMAFRRSG